MKIRLKHERLARELAQRPITLNRWAQLLGLRSGHLSELANGKRLHPTAATRRKLLDGLSLGFDDLFEVEPRRTEAVGFSNEGAAQPQLRASGRKEIDLMDLFKNDLRQALRRLVRQPAFSAAVIVTLALGLAVNVALFSLVKTMLIEPLPYPQSQRLLELFTTDLERGVERGNFSLPNALDLAGRASDVVDLAIYDWEPFSLSGGAQPARVGGGQVSARFFDVLGVDFLEGRGFLPGEDGSAGEAVTVLGEAVWRNDFGSDPGIVGREVVLDGVSTTVVGVVPAMVQFPDIAEIWKPLPFDSADFGRDSRWLRTIARLRPGVELAQAQDRLSEVMRQLEEEYPDANEGRGIVALPIHESRVGRIRPIFLLLFGAVGFVMLIVCANVANLLLASAIGRRQEMAIRSALGADRGRLVRELLTESALLGLIGLTCALLLTPVLLALGQRLIPVELPLWSRPEIDLALLGYALVLTIAATLFFGLAPALHASRRGDFHAAHLRSRGSIRQRHLRSALVVGEVALTLVLLTGAGLLLRTLFEIGSVEPGFRSDGALTFGLDLLAYRNEEPEVRGRMMRRYYERFQSLPGVDAVGWIDGLPLSGRYHGRVFTAQTPEVEDYSPWSQSSVVSPGYFAAMGIPLLQGEDFSFEDGDPGGEAAETNEKPRFVIVSQLLADRIWPQGNALGQLIKFGKPEDFEPWFEIRGVVGDVRHRALAEEALPSIYTTEGSHTLSRATWVLRTERQPSSLAPEVRSAVLAIDRNQPLHAVVALAEHVDESIWEWRFFAYNLWSMAAFALLLAALGLYGVMAYSVSQRRAEVGLRMALGAKSSDVQRLVIAQGGRLIAVGTLVGLPFAFLIARGVAGLLFGVPPMDWLALGTVIVLLFGVGILAVYLPARRASSIDPIDALRCE